MQIFTDDFLKICDIAKMMKSTVISFYNGDIFGYELNIVNMKHCEHLKLGPPEDFNAIFTCFNKDLQSFAKDIKGIPEYVSIDEYSLWVDDFHIFRLDLFNKYNIPEQLVKAYGQDVLDHYTYINDKGVIDTQMYSLNNILNIYGRILYDLNSTIDVKVYDNLKDDILFNDIMANKSGDGSFLYIKDSYIMSLFIGLLPVNKSDTVDLVIYDLNFFSFISKFIITKKKVKINLYTRYSKLT